MDKRIGADVKIMQYENKATCMNRMNILFRNTMKELLNKNNKSKSIDTNDNIILLNMEKDKYRYTSSVNELKYLNVDNFVHMKTSFWKDRDNLLYDLNYILNFLRKFNSDIPDKYFTINEFSEINDENITIQDGPLGCYCAHLKAMIYGYQNFNNYTAIVEDDIFLANTELIEKYLKEIPDDWDMICLNAMPKTNVPYSEPYYKHIYDFHSTHFYIVNHKCFETLFKNMYPINEQVDVLISNLIKTLNIYNIPNTVYQKVFSTNTQNNLHTIFTSENYQDVRNALTNAEKSMDQILNVLLSDNEKYNKFILNYLMYDIVYSYIIDIYEDNLENESIKNEKYKLPIKLNEFNEIYDELYKNLYYVAECCIKSSGIKDIVNDMIDYITETIMSFTYHNKYNDLFNENMKAYFYGSTSHVYLLEKNDVIAKVYNKKFRWNIKGHDNYKEIYDKELNILKLSDNFINNDDENNIIYMKYKGVSLYNQFNLPMEWKNDIKNIFEDLDKKNIYYPEFNLNNILVKNNKLYFIDYGLAKINENMSNDYNCKIFIELLEMLDNRFKKNDYVNNNILYRILLTNLRQDNKYSNNIF